MLGVSSRVLSSGVLATALVGSVIALASADDQNAKQVPRTELVRKSVALAPRVAPRAPLSGLNPLVHSLQDGRLVSPLDAGGHAELTLDPGLQQRVEKILADAAVPYGALVALDPQTGKVLAYASHSTANPEAGDLARDATPPAASVFKVITASALIDAGIAADERVCYAGGFSRLLASDLVDDVRRDRACATLSQALGGSINSVFAKLADKHLDAATLRRYARAFGFGQTLAFDLAMGPSAVEIPDQRLEFARAAAGFWHTHMSPLHAALIAATIANAGVMPKPAIVERALDANGKLVQSFRAENLGTVVTKATAQSVGAMMLRTVSSGTAHGAFFDERGRAFLPDIAVAGKTGSLSAESPYRAYSWWVGFAPADKPTIALAALIVNTPKWRIKSSFLAREALREYLVAAPERLRRAQQKAAVHPVPVRATQTPAG